jgi:SAM-dependent methyltransferase
VTAVDNVKASYTAFHASHKPAHVYPSEWLIRTLLGKYPKLELDKTRYKGAKILDVGFGDGRSWPLLHALSFDIYGVEITEDILRLGRERARALGVDAKLAIGTNASIPFDDGFFDFILASASCYYVDEGTTFADNVREYYRVLKPGGTLIATLPEATSSIFDGAEELGDGHVTIRNDPWGLRNGYVFRWFRSDQEVRDALSPAFSDFSTGLCCDNYYGIRINLFLLVCRKAVVDRA